MTHFQIIKSGGISSFNRNPSFPSKIIKAQGRRSANARNLGEGRFRTELTSHDFLELNSIFFQEKMEEKYARIIL